MVLRTTATGRLAVSVNSNTSGREAAVAAAAITILFLAIAPPPAAILRNVIIMFNCVVDHCCSSADCHNLMWLCPNVPRIVVVTLELLSSEGID